MLVRDGKYLIGLKIFATFALVCTLVLWAGLWIASATPGTESGSSTQFVTDKIDSKYDVSSKFDAKVVTQNITLERTGTERFYAYQSEQLKLTFSPQNTLDKEVYFESENEDIVTVNSNGVATCHSWGSTYVYVRLKSNPSVYNFVEINCYGKNPQDIPNNAISLPDTIKVGTSALTAVNDRQTAPDCATFASSDDSVAARRLRLRNLRRRSDYNRNLRLRKIRIYDGNRRGQSRLCDAAKNSFQAKSHSHPRQNGTKLS